LASSAPFGNFDFFTLFDLPWKSRRAVVNAKGVPRLSDLLALALGTH
jgi:hypothetical protein